MDRRDFLKATFAASAATVALAEAGAIVRRPLPVGDDEFRVDPDGKVEAMRQGQLVPLADGRTQTTDINKITQHLMQRLAEKLRADKHPTVLAEHVLPVDGGRPWGHDGCKIGHVVSSYQPGPETFMGLRHVTLTDQVSSLWVVPSHRTGGRAEHYSLMEDVMRIIPEVEADPVVLDRLEPVIDSLHAQVRRRGLNVFTPGLYMPQFGDPGPACESAVGLASRDYGLAMRVVRCLGHENVLMMRADLIGGTFPVDVPVDPSLVG